MKVTQISIGRFHHFHLARQLAKRDRLDCIWTGYPRFKLRNERGIPPSKIKTFPWLHAPYMARGHFRLDGYEWLNREWAWRARQTLDQKVKGSLKYPGSLIALSGSGLKSGTRMKELGGTYICDRGSTHIEHQNAILNEEYARWGVKFPGIDVRVISKELTEYDTADAITIPSEFVRRTFIEWGVPSAKIHKASFGADLSRFRRVADPNANRFRVLWVGSVSIQKGFLYALEAFRQFRHVNKEFLVIGPVENIITKEIRTRNLTGVRFLGHIPNNLLPKYYSTANAFVLSSLQEGLAMVQAEALACGCPIIATPNTGCEDLIDDGVEGYVVPIRSPESISERLQMLADDSALQRTMSEAAIQKVKQLGGWETYGDEICKLLIQLEKLTH